MSLAVVPPTELDAAEAAHFVAAAANILALPIDPEYHASVVQNFVVLMGHARLIMTFALEATIEVAPVFRA